MLNANRTEAAALCGIDAAELVEWAAGENNATFVKPAVEEPEPETEAPETKCLQWRNPKPLLLSLWKRLKQLLKNPQNPLLRLLTSA